MLPDLPREKLLDFCRRMLLIRHFEERLIALHDAGEFRGHYHVYIGQEATGVAAISCLGDGDYIFTTHRNHGHLLARGAEPGRIFAEILGRRDGYNRGKGGSFHVAAAALGFLQTSGVVAGILPLAIGTAYAAKALKKSRVTLCCFGDGALEEGAAPEALNLASLWKLPVLFLCENNGKYGAGRAAGAAQSESMAAYPLTDLPRAYKIPVREIDGADAGAVHAAVFDAIERIRTGGGPRFIETQTVRWPGSETNWPAIPAPTDIALAWDAGSVPEKARNWYRGSDPLLAFARELAEARQVTRDELAQMERDIKDRVEAAARFALASPYPDAEEALKDVFARA